MFSTVYGRGLVMILFSLSFVVNVHAQSASETQSLNSWSGLGILAGIVMVVFAAAGIAGLMLVKKTHEESHAPQPQSPLASQSTPTLVAQSIQGMGQQSSAAVTPPVLSPINQSVLQQPSLTAIPSVPAHPATAPLQPPVIPPFSPEPVASQPPQNPTPQIQQPPSIGFQPPTTNQF
jgi:hypothetical protein